MWVEHAANALLEHIWLDRADECAGLWSADDQRAHAGLGQSRG
jgi:hypothetical protein